jgi:hypothetical protein
MKRLEFTFRYQYQYQYLATTRVTSRHPTYRFLNLARIFEAMGIRDGDKL